MQFESRLERWPLREPFTISRTTFTDSVVWTVTLRDEDGRSGRGECEPHESDVAAAQALVDAAGLSVDGTAPRWLQDATRRNLGSVMPRSALRNAIDCALWDLECRQRGVRANRIAGLSFEPVHVMPTLGIDTPERMADAAHAHAGASCVKVKLGSADGRDAERLEAVAGALRGVPLLLDANAGWSPRSLAAMLPLAQRLGARIIEQPLPPELDEHMPKPPGDIIFCADESCLDRSSLARVQRHFQCINIKLDKAGGLSEALALRAQAQASGLEVMVGMMSGTSLAVAPAFVLAQGIELVDLEIGFLTRDREHPMRIDDFMLQPPEAGLWG